MMIIHISKCYIISYYFEDKKQIFTFHITNIFFAILERRLKINVTIKSKLEQE